MNKITIYIGRVLSFMAIMVLLATQSSATVSALTAEQKRVIQSGAIHFNVEETELCSTQPSYSPTTSNSVYVIGDSLTVGMNKTQLGEASLSSVLTARGFSPTINAQGCRPLYNATNEAGFTGDGSSCPVGTITSAFNEFETDRSIIATAGTIVIALGTNNYEGSEEVFKAKAIEYINLIKQANANIGNRIFWVNTFAKGGGLSTRAATISEIVSETGVQLIDYRSAAQADTVKYSYPSNDSTHNDNNGYTNKVTLVADALGTPTAASPTATGSPSGYDPISLTYPSFPNEPALIQATKDFITNNYSRSPFASNLQYVDQIFTLSKARNVNPLLVMAIAKQENGFGGSASSATANNNYFGITQGDGYRHFDTVEEGIDYFVEKVGRHVSNPDGNYADIQVFYDYLSVHQIGYIAYPGEYPHPDYGQRNPPLLGADPRMPEVVMNWETSWNPGTYYKNSIGMINELLGLNLSEVPVRGASTIQPGGGCSGAQQSRGVAGANGWDLPGLGDNPMVYYSQRSSRVGDIPEAEGYFGSEPYGHGTIGQCGCGPTSMAMAVSTVTGNRVEPPEMAAWSAANGGQNSPPSCGSQWFWTYSSAQERWGVNVTHLTTLDEVKASLSSGAVIIISSNVTNTGSPSPFTRGGHILIIRAFTDDGKFLFADPNDHAPDSDNAKSMEVFGNNSRSNTPILPEQFMPSIQGMWAVTAR